MITNGDWIAKMFSDPIYLGFRARPSYIIPKVRTMVSCNWAPGEVGNSPGHIHAGKWFDLI